MSVRYVLLQLFCSYSLCYMYYYYYYYLLSSTSSSFFITLILAIYNYVPQTHHVCTVRTAAAILQLQFMLHVMLFPMLNVLHFYIITFRSVCAVLNTADFYSPLTYCFPEVLLRYCLNALKMVPVAPVITGTTTTKATAFRAASPRTSVSECQVFRKHRS